MEKQAGKNTELEMEIGLSAYIELPKLGVLTC